ncbi:MAG: hypothetical protein AAF160_20055 [Pseudomonadota bacterium]
MEALFQWLAEKVGAAVAGKAGSALFDSLAVLWRKLRSTQSAQREVIREDAAALAAASALLDALVSDKAALTAQLEDARRERDDALCNLRALTKYARELELRCEVPRDGEGKVRLSGS